MDRRTQEKILKGIERAVPWESNVWREQVLKRMIDNPEMNKKDMLKLRIKCPGRRKLVDFKNEYIASKYIEVFRRFKDQ